MTEAEKIITDEENAELLALVDSLPGYNKRALLRELRRDAAAPIRRWSTAIGSISDEDAAEMLAAIEDEFERIPGES
ncbi:MAG: hypothetical protein HYU66_00075 [Armatimonadetes bacterium]|nr:hypothetical protein [Armatimonadota bacterium]